MPPHFSTGKWGAHCQISQQKTLIAEHLCNVIQIFTKFMLKTIVCFRDEHQVFCPSSSRCCCSPPHLLCLNQPLTRPCMLPFPTSFANLSVTSRSADLFPTLLPEWEISHEGRGREDRALARTGRSVEEVQEKPACWAG